MSRLAEAEKKLQNAIAALESAFVSLPSAPEKQDSPDNSAILAEMQAIDSKIEQAMTLVAKAQQNGDATPSGDAE